MHNIIHYYARGGMPFQSITSLSQQEANRIANELKKTGLPVFKRFEGANIFLKDAKLNPG
jgi:hypothetical protein